MNPSLHAVLMGGQLLISFLRQRDAVKDYSKFRAGKIKNFVDAVQPAAKKDM
jgi:hypothetical protein